MMIWLVIATGVGARYCTPDPRVEARASMGAHVLQVSRGDARRAMEKFVPGSILFHGDQVSLTVWEITMSGMVSALRMCFMNLCFPDYGP